MKITIANTTLTRPSISNDGLYIYVGSTDGEIYGFSTNDGTAIGNIYDLYDSADDYPGDSPEEIAANARRDYWSSYPMVAEGRGQGLPLPTSLHYQTTSFAPSISFRHQMSSNDIQSVEEEQDYTAF